MTATRTHPFRGCGCSSRCWSPHWRCACSSRHPPRTRSARPQIRERRRASRRKASTPEKLFGAIVKVSVQAVPDARSAATLGSEREGTGVVIGDDGLILTIGYLIVEADDVSVTDSRGPHARRAGRRLRPRHAASAWCARSRRSTPSRCRSATRASSPKREPVMIAGAGDDGVAFAYVVSKRAFSGNWEYALDQAIYTSPPTLNWSGAGADRQGRQAARRGLADRARGQRRRARRCPATCSCPSTC